jgi:ring-1,2-phenylacetyl-CoA epoxidase subunit PaaC
VNGDTGETGETVRDYQSLWVEAPASQIDPMSTELLLALADDELVMGHRHAEWLGLSPFLEEDLTMASIAQDELGHARALYGLIWPDWAERDAMVVRRPPHSWRSCAFVELHISTWEHSLIRHWIYDIAEEVRWAHLAETVGNRINGLSALAAKVLQEERFHRTHAQQLVARLSQSGDANHQRLVVAFDNLQPHIFSLFGGGGAVEAAFHKQLLAAASTAAFHIQVNPIRGDDVDDVDDFADVPSARNLRTSDFASAHAAMLDVVAFDAQATW